MASPVQQLIQALRSPLPEGFEWDFRWGETCALGLAERMGLSLADVSYRPFSSWEDDGIAPLYGVPAADVTPAMVADALERIVIGRELGANAVLVNGIEIDLTGGRRV